MDKVKLFWIVLCILISLNHFILAQDERITSDEEIDQVFNRVLWNFAYKIVTQNSVINCS